MPTMLSMFQAIDYGGGVEVLLTFLTQAGEDWVPRFCLTLLRGRWASTSFSNCPHRMQYLSNPASHIGRRSQWGRGEESFEEALNRQAFRKLNRVLRTRLKGYRGMDQVLRPR